MNTIRELGDLVRGLGEELGLAIETDGKTFIFTYDELYECAISADEASSRVELRTLLCLVGDENRDAIFERALQLNLNRQRTQGAIIALSGEVLSLRTRILDQSLDRAKLGAALAQFIETARDIRHELVNTGAEAPTAGGLPFAGEAEQFVVIQP